MEKKKYSMEREKFKEAVRMMPVSLLLFVLRKFVRRWRGRAASSAWASPVTLRPAARPRLGVVRVCAARTPRGLRPERFVSRRVPASACCACARRVLRSGCARDASSRVASPLLRVEFMRCVLSQTPKRTHCMSPLEWGER